MKILLYLTSIITGISLLIALVNTFTMRTLNSDSTEISEHVSLLVPMRNEEKNAVPLVQALLASKNLLNRRITILNDHSEDSTLSQLQTYSDQIEIVNGLELPAGWMGKPYACYQLGQNSDSQYLVFLDADVRPSPLAISSAIALMEKLGWDFLSPYPAQRAQTWLMKVIQPLLQWSWLSSVPLRIAESGRFASMIIANGQFFMVKRFAYNSIGGHESVKAEVLEDLCLARTLSGAGFRGGVADGSHLVECTMYEKNSDLIAGYTKSLWKAFGGLFGTICAVILLALTQLAPIVLLSAGYYWAALPFVSAGVTHLLTSVKTRSAPINTLAHPLAALILIALICESYRRKSLGRLEWRGRTVL